MRETACEGEGIPFKRLPRTCHAAPVLRQPPNMRRYSGRLREVVAYQKRLEFASEKRSRDISFLDENLLHAISKLRYV